MLLVVILAALGVLLTVLIARNCEHIGPDAWLKCESTFGSVNLLSPIAAWVVNCMLWRKMTIHKV